MTTADAHWNACIRAFLHDPPDKALSIKDHEQRAVRYLAAALGIPVEEARDEHAKAADWLASAIERLPLPKGTIRDCNGNEADPVLEQPFNRIPRERLERSDAATGEPTSNRSVVFREAQDLGGDAVDRRADTITDIARANADPHLRAYALWRLLPEQLPKICQLPGDTRLTDHSIIDHADAATACAAALGHGSGASLLVFSLGPVQQFIVQGRSLRDLWTGSYLLSWLTFHAMLPIVEELGPWCITSPGLRGNPLCDRWLGEQGVRRPGSAGCQPAYLMRTSGDGDPRQARLSEELRPNIRHAGTPNTFTAMVPTGRAEELQRRVREAVDAEWRAIGDAVLDRLREAWDDDDTGRLAAGAPGAWHWQWPEQCAAVWDVRCRCLPVIDAVGRSEDVAGATGKLRKCYRELVDDVLPQPVRDAGAIAATLRAEGIAPGYVHEETQGFWPLANELAQRLLEADKRARRVPPAGHSEDTREKCSLFAGFSVMGPNEDTRANRDWWDKHIPMLPGDLGAFVKGQERLSAPGLVKRFAYGAYFRDKLGDLPFPDTREAAFTAWCAQLPAGAWKDWKGAVRRSNRAFDKTLPSAAFEYDTPWELLDAGQGDDKFWILPGDPQPTRDRLRKAAHEVRKARAALLRRAAEVGLPDPKPYYAVLCADGDDMGKVLRGERGPSFAQAYHPWMLDKLKELAEAGRLAAGAPRGGTEPLWDRVRPQGLAAQLAFSAGLNAFTGEAARAIAEHQGTCVYAGGDDVLAVLPVATCLQAAAELAALFQREVGGTLSAGIAVVHCHDDLRVAIDSARKAEDLAKRSGRDGLALRIVRRSGETSEAYCPWYYRQVDDAERERADPAYKHRQTRNLADDWQTIAEVLAGQSDRWIHHLLDERAALRHMPLEAVWARARHLLLHGEEGEKRKRAFARRTDGELRELPQLLDLMREIWADTSTGLHGRAVKAEMADRDIGPWLVDQFITWCQHAAWLARFMPRQPDGDDHPAPQAAPEEAHA